MPIRIRCKTHPERPGRTRRCKAVKIGALRGNLKPLSTVRTRVPCSGADRLQQSFLAAIGDLVFASIMAPNNLLLDFVGNFAKPLLGALRFLTV